MRPAGQQRDGCPGRPIWLEPGRYRVHVALFSVGPDFDAATLKRGQDLRSTPGVDPGLTNGQRITIDP
jgi:hypothetical protein